MSIIQAPRNQIATSVRLLMVDDSPDDIFLVGRALEHAGLGQFFHAVEGGSEAIAYLQGDGQYAERDKFPFPNILLLDIKMPGMTGFDVLRWLQLHPACKIIPTLAFSSSFLPVDVVQFYQLGGNAYMTKPSGYKEIATLFQKTFDYWALCLIPAPPPAAHC